MIIPDNPPSLNSHPPDDPSSICSTPPQDAIVITPNLLSSTGSIHSNNASELGTLESQDIANVVPDGSFMGITKKDIDDEFQKLIDELSERAINHIKFSLDGPHFGHDMDDGNGDGDYDSDSDHNGDHNGNHNGDHNGDHNGNSNGNSDSDSDGDSNNDQSMPTPSTPDAPANTTSPSVLTKAQQLKLMQEQQWNEMELHSLLLQAIKDSLFADPFLEQSATALKIPEDQRIIIDDRSCHDSGQVRAEDCLFNQTRQGE
ncbi:hypothetical protein BGZ74_005280 [Mortierella antarctica]|nr:hypothetical protein BGZ74_005280 [Mortierella antarctica]